MLHRSFKPAKCKTALRLAVSRIKLLKNKREAQLKQLKRDLAQLLESGQDKTARIRVEHVVREEKTMAAYDLVEVYCELITARLPIIESQKNCPIDLKEAIASVIFASPRCSDIPELMDIRKHFTAKYGKEFVTAALEIRPQCGVSRSMVEKLSVNPPDGQTKIKILTAIAKEHNINWEPKSFEEEESKPPEVLLSGPDTFERASKMQMEPPDVLASSSHEKRADVPSNLYEHNVRSSWSSQSMSPYNSQAMPSLSSQNLSSTDFGANKEPMPDISPLEQRSSGTVHEEMDFRHSYSQNVNPVSPGRKSWNMQFKDATAAAQAAAESAELASMAARAAAELSSRGSVNPQYSAEPQKSSALDSREQGPGKFGDSKFQEEHMYKVSVNNSFHDRNPRSQSLQMDGNQQGSQEEVPERLHRDGYHRRSSESSSSKSNSSSMDGNQQDTLAEVSERLHSDGYHRRSSRSSSLKSNSSSIDEVNTGQRSDSYSQRASSAVKSTGLETGNFRKSDESEAGYLSEPQGPMKDVNVDHSGNVWIGRESSNLSSRSYLSTPGDAYDEISNLNTLRSDNNPGGNLFAGTVQANSQKELEEANSFDNPHVVFDDYSSDDNDDTFDWRSKTGVGLNADFQSPGRKSPTHLAGSTNAWSPRQDMNESIKKFSASNFSSERHSLHHDFSETPTKSNSVAPSQREDLLPVTFDDSDGRSSESEKELDQPTFSGKADPSSIHIDENIHQRDPMPPRYETQELEGSSWRNKKSEWNRKPLLDTTSDDSDTAVPKRDQGRDFRAESQKRFGFSDQSPSNRSPDRNDLDHEAVNKPVDEEKHVQSHQSSGLSFDDEVEDTNDIDVKNSYGKMEKAEVSQSSWESGKELKFETLTGGLRNKGYRRPPYFTQPSSNTSLLSKQTADDSASAVQQTADDSASTVQQFVASSSPKRSIASRATHQPTGSPSVMSFASHAVKNQEAYSQEARPEVNKKPMSTTRNTYFDSDTDDSEEELPELPQHSSRKASYKQKAGAEIDKKPSSRGPNTYFDMDDDSEEDVPKPTLASKNRPASSFSRRTKTSPKFETSSQSNSGVASETSTSSNNIRERKPSSRRSNSNETVPEAQLHTISSVQRERDLSSWRLYTTETIPESQYQTKIPGRHESYERQRSSGQATHKPMPEPRTSLEKENSPATEQQSNPALKPVASVTSESSKTSSSKEPPSRENSISKASHVHPKLPDYDTLAARFQSLRMNRQ